MPAIDVRFKSSANIATMKTSEMRGMDSRRRLKNRDEGAPSVHCARGWSAWPSSLEGRAAGMSADRMTSALPGRLEEIAIVVAGYLCVRACSQQAWLLGTWRASRFVIIGKKGSCTTQGVCFRAQTIYLYMSTS